MTCVGVAKIESQFMEREILKNYKHSASADEIMDL